MLNDFPLTENGAAVEIVENSLLEIFSKQLTRGNSPILPKLETRENIETATLLTFYSRCIKHGAGERDIFYTLFVDLVGQVPAILPHVVKFIHDPQTGGYFKDFFNLMQKFGNSEHTETLLRYYCDLLKKDAVTEGSVSLAAKYAPRQHGKFWDPYGIRLSKLFGEDQGFKTPGEYHKYYRKEITRLTAKIDVVEAKMCDGRWNEITFQKVPSRAMRLYGARAFPNINKDGSPRYDVFDRIQCAERFEQYKIDLQNGETKVNASTLGIEQFAIDLQREDTLIESQFESFLNGLKNGEENIPPTISIVDVSGSMAFRLLPNVTAMQIASLMGLITSHLDENSPFYQRAITFETEPRWINLSEKETYHDKYEKLLTSPWGGSTDFEKTYELVLQLLVTNNVPPETVKGLRLLVLSDMQFNVATRDPWKTLHQNLVERFREKGYEPPHIIYWDLSNRNTYGNPASDHTPGVTMVSGFGSGQIIDVLKGNYETDPLEKMYEILYSDHFKPIRDSLLNL